MGPNDKDTETLTKLKEPFAPNQIRSREGPKKNGQPQFFKYVPTDVLQERLDTVLGPSWDWIIISSNIQTVTKTKDIWENRQKVGKETIQVDQVIVHGRLSLHLPSGTVVNRDSFGGCDLNYGTTAGDPHKIADSNAFRKACDKFGIAREVGGEDKEAAATSAIQSNNRFATPQPGAPSQRQDSTQSAGNNPFLKR